MGHVSLTNINIVLNDITVEIFPLNSGTRKCDPGPLLVNIVLEAVASAPRKGWMDVRMDGRKTYIGEK